VLFALGNSSDAFLLVRAHEVGLVGQGLPLLWAFHHLVKSLAAVPGGALSDRHSRGVVVSFGWAAYALTYIGFGFASLRWQILVLLSRVCAYHGLAEGAERAIIADLSEPRRARARLRPVSRAGRGGGAARRSRDRPGLDKWGPAWALGANAAFAAMASAFLFALTFAGPLRPRPGDGAGDRRTARPHSRASCSRSRRMRRTSRNTI
jgi:hypothetical protein